MTLAPAVTPLDLVKDLKASGADTVIGPLKWDEKAILRSLNLASSVARRRRLVNRREVMPEDKLSHRPHAGRVKRLPLCPSSFYFCSRCLTASRWGAPTR